MSRFNFVERLVANCWQWFASRFGILNEPTWATPLAGRYLLWAFDVETQCPTPFGRQWLAERHRIGDHVKINGIDWTIRIANQIRCRCLECLRRREFLPLNESPERDDGSRVTSRQSAAAVRSPVRVGFTLVEMLVVLTILAVLAAVAVNAVEGVGEQARYEATQSTLNNIRTAIVGDGTLKNADGTRVVSGFIADIGRTPNSINELLTLPGDVIGLTTAAFDSDGDSTNDVSLMSGWNGPYLHAGAGVTQIRDGWARVFDVVPPALIADPWQVSSGGANGTTEAGETGFDVDLSISIPASERSEMRTFRTFQIDSVTGTRVDPTLPITSPEKVRVLMYGPNVNGGANGAVQSKALVIESPLFEVSQDLPIGRYAVRGVRWTDTDGDNVVDVGEVGGIKKSYVHYFSVLGGSAGTRMELELR